MVNTLILIQLLSYAKLSLKKQTKNESLQDITFVFRGPMCDLVSELPICFEICTLVISNKIIFIEMPKVFFKTIIFDRKFVFEKKFRSLQNVDPWPGVCLAINFSILESTSAEAISKFVFWSFFPTTRYITLNREEFEWSPSACDDHDCPNSNGIQHFSSSLTSSDSLLNQRLTLTKDTRTTIGRS